MQWPIRSQFRITSHFGHRPHPLSGAPDTHTGVDLGAAAGTRVVAAADGEVEFLGWRSGYGRTVVLRHPMNVRTVYAHLSAFAPAMYPGTRVTQGADLGRVGQTGWATGPHLHFEVRHGERAVDPLRADALAYEDLAEAQWRAARDAVPHATILVPPIANRARADEPA